MATLVIKNVPETLHEKLKERAQRNHRSLNKEAVAVLESAVLNLQPANHDAPAQDALSELFAAGDALAKSNVDYAAWATNRHEVWR